MVLESVVLTTGSCVGAEADTAEACSGLADSLDAPGHALDAGTASPVTTLLAATGADAPKVWA